MLCQKEYELTINDLVTPPDLYYKMDALTTSTPEAINGVYNLLKDEPAGGTVSLITDGIISNAISLSTNAGSAVAAVRLVKTSFLIPLNSWSLRLWIRYDGAQNIQDEPFVLYMGTGSTARLKITQLDPGPANYFIKYRGNTVEQTHVTDVIPGLWTHLVFVFDKVNSKVQLYLNTALSEITDTIAVPVSTSFQIAINGGAGGLQGVLDVDEVGLWNGHVLTQAEVIADYNGGAGETWPW